MSLPEDEPEHLTTDDMTPEDFAAIMKEPIGESKPTSGDPLFDHMQDEHHRTLLNSELYEIRLICRRMDQEEEAQAMANGQLQCPHHWLTAQRAALAEARRRIIARYKHVETWLKQSSTDEIIANWGGMVQGLREARMLIGGMWNELPVKNPNTPEVDEIIGMDTVSFSA